MDERKTSSNEPENKKTNILSKRTFKWVTHTHARAQTHTHTQNKTPFGIDFLTYFKSAVDTLFFLIFSLPVIFAYNYYFVAETLSYLVTFSDCDFDSALSGSNMCVSVTDK